ncbi:undecaprenyl-phosphate glucose phosphotransferase [Prosthecochloris sp.]|uniref:undecaprenyl-phosphate glucose phosphotransferase n=1 Tax=Prosthecochloris sp. TaxID=290513 RepID=UPI00257A880C|nr:undecaprenyl-phosphate glucose phosphotransferase [Prosthecochloris sp.]
MWSGVKPDWSGYVWLHRLLDSLLPIVTLSALVGLFSVTWHDRYMLLGFIGGFLFVTINQLIGTYDGWRGRSVTTSIKMVLKAWLGTWILFIILAFMFKRSADYSRVVAFSWAIVTFFVLIGYRGLFRLLLLYVNVLNVKKIVIVGAGALGQYLVDIVKKNPCLGYQIMGFYDDKLNAQQKTFLGLPVLGDNNQACVDAQLQKFDELYFCFPLGGEEEIKALLNKLTYSTVIVKFIPDLFTFELMHAKWINLKGIPVISVYDTPLSSDTARILKRLVDISISMLILLLIWPIMLLLAIGVKLSSPGPIFYRQKRVGWNGKGFSILKFRSMPEDVEKVGVQWGNSKNKPKTRFGEFIRSTSLDELPQFINVLRGDMSIVGPRPERDIFIKKISEEIPRYMQRHMVKAGITGWAQVNGWRGDTSLEKRIEYDLHYINNWSLWLDLKIIFLTTFRGWKNKNAY